MSESERERMRLPNSCPVCGRWIKRYADFGNSLMGYAVVITLTQDDEIDRVFCTACGYEFDWRRMRS